MPPMMGKMTELLAELRERHGVDWDTAAAIAFQRSVQQNVSLTRALADLVAELNQQQHVNRQSAAAGTRGENVMGPLW